ncbi:MAG: hypothetical protein MUF31_01050 [Akkermansiaceae bacterium]|jgi:tetratricopeptide (TPR) repeat protein|nr:hypothetical protein [Akkermansiaceae bacterium]
MKAPQLEAFGERELLGTGPCGAVFRAVREDGEVTAVKLLDGMAINRALLEEATARLEKGGWPDGVLPILEADYRTKPAVRVTPCLADVDEEGVPRPRSLQHRLADFPGEDSWDVVMALADALAEMHARQVAHGNLKPGNVFFDEEGGLTLVDWCLGNMPGVGQMDFTDAILYQPPEQLREPEAYLHEAGYRWDVHAWGVLAFRLITGRFPRANATFIQVAPPPGETHREGLQADLLKVANTVESQRMVEWPTEAEGEKERRWREVIDTCLALEPGDRPANAMEVRHRLQAVEREMAEEEQRDAVLDQRRHAQKAAGRAGMAAGVLLGAAVLMGFLWHVAKGQFAQERERRIKSEALAVKQEQRAAEELGRARKSERQAVAALQAGEATWLARIEASRDLGDRLFSWAIEEDHRTLPPLDGRKLRLQRLEDYYEQFLERTDGLEGLGDERARARLHLAEISLAMGEPDLAAKRFEVALASADDLEPGAALDLRLATDRLLLAILFKENGDPRAGETFESARQALMKVPQAEVDADRVAYLLATLDLRESELLAAAGDEVAALEHLHRATEELNRLADQRPEAALLRSELVACYLSSATILDGMGELGDARGLREMAAAKLLQLIEDHPGDLKLREELAGCYGALAESSLVAGDVSRAESMSKGATKLLTEILSQRPESASVKSRLAAQHGIMAGILRDRGESEEALRRYDEGLHLLEGLVVGDGADPLARFRYALLTWEKGRMLGFAGDRKSEIAHEEKSLEMLLVLLESSYGVSRAESIKRSIGYLLGDLGHAREAAGEKDGAEAAFGEAVKIWESLHRDRPASEEYEEALDWNRQRLAEFRPEER